jgi:hypothetical protein
MPSISGAVNKVKGAVTNVTARPVWYILFGMLFAAFLFPFIAKQLASLKYKLVAGGGVGKTVGDLIPTRFTGTTAGPPAP